MQTNAKIFVAGGRGLVGSAIVRKLRQLGFQNILTPTSSELNLLDQQKTEQFFADLKPEYVFDAAAKVGGIMGNKTYPADFIYENIQIQSNIIFSAHKYGVKKLLFLGSSCIYPKEAPLPIKEESLLTGPLEYTNEAYAIAKIAGMMMCKKYFEQYGDIFISAMPTNLYGINDNFHPTNSHLIPGLIRRFHEAKVARAKEVIVWGSGKPRRELLYADDLAAAVVLMMQEYSDPLEFINVGTGEDISVKEIAELVKEVIGFKGELVFDTNKPDGTFRKVMNVDRIKALGWKPQVELREGIKLAYDWFVQNAMNR